MCVRMMVRARFLVGFACQFSRFPPSSQSGANRGEIVGKCGTAGSGMGKKVWGLFQGDDKGIEWLR